MPMNKPRNRRPERLLLIAADPNEIPVWRLQTCGECCAEARTSAHADPPGVQRGGIGDAGELELARPEM